MQGSAKMHGSFSKKAKRFFCADCTCWKDRFTCKVKVLACAEGRCKACANPKYKKGHHIGCTMKKRGHSSVGKTHGEVAQASRARTKKLVPSKKKKSNPFLMAKGMSTSPSEVAAAARGTDAWWSGSTSSSNSSSAQLAAAAPAAVAVPPEAVVVAIEAPTATAAIEAPTDTASDEKCIIAVTPYVSSEIRKFASGLPWVNARYELAGGDDKVYFFIENFARNNVMPFLKFRAPSIDVNVRPDVDVFATKDLNVRFVRWEYFAPQHPAIKDMKCPECAAPLPPQGIWSSGAKEGALRTVFGDGRNEHVVSWRYKKCARCGNRATSMDKRILQQVPRALARLSGVDPVWQKPGILLSAELTRQLEYDIVTYLGISNIEERLRTSLNALFEAHRIEYREAVLDYTVAQGGAQDCVLFPPFELWLGRTQGVVGGAMIRDRYLEYYYDPLGVRVGEECMSQDDFLHRVMQSISCLGVASYDATYKSSKHFANKDVVAQVNLATDCIEIAIAVLVPSEKRSAIRHAVETFSHRPNAQITCLGTDLCPRDEDFNKAHFPHAKLRVDTYHVFDRILSSLNDPHCDAVAASRALSRTVWVYNAADVAKVRAALQDGTLNGELHTDAEIDAMSKFFSKYRKYIASHTKSTAMIQAGLREWFKTWGGKIDAKRGGVRLASDTTQATVDRQIAIARYFTDTDSTPRVLRKLPNQKHDLQVKCAARGSKVETAHASMAHFANLGSGCDFAHALHMNGIARFNARQTQKKSYNAYETDVSTAPHYRLELKYHVNEVARLGNQPLPHPSLAPLKPNNKESMMYKYFKEEQRRQADFAARYPTQDYDAGLCVTRYSSKGSPAFAARPSLTSCARARSLSLSSPSLSLECARAARARTIGLHVDALHARHRVEKTPNRNCRRKEPPLLSEATPHCLRTTTNSDVPS